MPTRLRLPASEAQRHLPRLHEALSKADYDRLERLLPLFEPSSDSQAMLAACLEALTPGLKPQDQLAAFRAFRQRLHKATRTVGWGPVPMPRRRAHRRLRRAGRHPDAVGRGLGRGAADPAQRP